ncbi:MAG: hypothetical protein AB1847_07425 [bacterium]
MIKNDRNNFMSAPEKLMIGEEIQKDLESYSQQILAELPPGLLWEWDDRFDVPLLVFPKDMEEEILTVINHRFPNQWDINSVKSSPPPIRKLLDKTFGIQPRQTVFAMDTNREVFLFALCWPWNDEVTISLRISLTGKGIVGIDQEKIEEYLRKWFRL